MVIIDAVSRQLPGVVGWSVCRGFFFRVFSTILITLALLSGESESLKFCYLAITARSSTGGEGRPQTGRSSAGRICWPGQYFALFELRLLCRVAFGAGCHSRTRADMRSVRRYGAKKVLVVAPLQNPSRQFVDGQALSFVRECYVLDKKSEKKVPYWCVAEAPRSGVHWLELKRRVLERDSSALLVFCADELFAKEASHFDTMMCLDEMGDKIPLSCEVSVVLDRLFGSR